MKAYIIEAERDPRKKELQDQTLGLLRINGWAAEVIHARENGNVNADETNRFLKDAETLDEDEYCLLMPDRIGGPVLPLQDLERRIRASGRPMMMLAKTTGIAALSKRVFQHPLFLRWISEGMDTKKLEQMISGELFQTGELRKLSEKPFLDFPAEMIRELEFPFFSTEVFLRSFPDAISTTLGNQARMLREELKGRRYDIDPLMKYLILTCHQGDLLKTMQFFFVLPSGRTHAGAEKTPAGEKKLALGMHLYYADMIPQSREYAGRFPEETDIIITTSDEEKKKKIEKEFSRVKCNSLDVRVIQNRGRDVSSLVVGMRDIAEWKYVCYYHDKKSLQTKPGSIGAGFSYQCAENLFASPDYVKNIVRLFETEDRLGMLSPPPPNHSDYYFTMGLPWGPNWDRSFELYRDLGLSVPIAMEKAPVAPLGTCFWFRGAALRNLISRNWKYEDFPPEPNGTDGTILHAFERIYPFCAQESGYYPAYVCSDRFAANLRTTLMHYVRNYNQVSGSFGICRKTEDMIREVGERIGERNV